VSPQGGIREDGGVRKDTQCLDAVVASKRPKGIPGNYANWGLSRFVRAGGRQRQLIQARQNPHRLASPKSEDTRESDRSDGAFMRAKPMAKGFVRLCSLPLEHSLSLRRAGAGNKSEVTRWF
jgi:hypothetical protein